jgi:hypothetical protein
VLDGLYKWKVLPFGLPNVPAALMQTINPILRLDRSYSVVYLDDILIHFPIRASHLHNVEVVLECFCTARLNLNGKKCIFKVVEMSFVGYYVSANGINTKQKKVERICSWLVPKSGGELHSVLRVATYHHEFIEKFAHCSVALHNLVNMCIGPSCAVFHLEELYQTQFDGLKRTLSRALVLMTIDPTKDFVQHIDTSDLAVGAVLAQWQNW